MPNEANLAPVLQHSLKQAYGQELELTADDGSSMLFSIKAEFKLGEAVYAALQSEAMRREDEVELFRVIGGDGSDPQLETIENDEEWEAASEAYDDLMFGGNEMP